ncbi:MAG: hypothetical protein ACI89D_001220 [Bermanella sp.]|jgi:hypothetical protein
MATAAEIVEQALADYFAGFAGACDVPPARRYFIEGYLKAVIDAELLSPKQARTLVADLCERYLGAAAAEIYRSDEARLILHSHTPRAPVYPSGE